MKVCRVAYTFCESDSRVRQYAKALVKRGDTVDVLALRRPGQDRHEVISGVSVYSIQERIVDERGPITYLSKICTFLVRAAFILTERHIVSAYQMVHVHSVPDFLVFAAFVPKLTNVPVVLDIHDILLVPKRATSPFGNEAASTKIQEFMALNVPLVVSRTRVDSYYYNDSMVKFFESDNDADLAESILLLKNDRQLRDRLALNAARHARENSWEVRKYEYLNLVDSLVTRARQASGVGHPGNGQAG